MSASPKMDVGERRAQQNAGRPLRSVLLAVGIFYLVAGLLNGTYLYEDAQNRDLEKSSTRFWITLTRPFATASEFLKLHLYRDQVETIRKE